MKRVAGVLLALLALPLAAASQQVPAGPDGTHLVSSGETLGSIAQRYYGSASEWQRLFDANSDQLSDPDVLEPGVSLRIPGGGASPAAVVGVEMRGPAPIVQDAMVPQDRRALLETSSFEPRGEPDVPASARTVFFEFFSPVEEGPGVVLDDGGVGASAAPLAVAEGSLLEAGWIVPPGESPADTGLVTEVLDGASVPGSEVNTGVYGHVRIRSDAGGTFEVGERYQTFSLGPSLDGVGRVAVPSGIVEVTETGGGLATAKVLRLFGRVGAGALLGPVPSSTLEPGVYPTETDMAVSGRLVALQQPAVLYIPKIFAFSDLGSDSGIQIGDELVGVADDTPEWSSETLARFQVVGVGGDTSTLLLMSTTVPRAVGPGLRVVLDRGMP